MVLYTVFLLNTSVYRLSVLTISTLSTQHNLLSFLHIFVINRLKFGKTYIGTCLATKHYFYHCIVGCRISKSKERKRNNIRSPRFLPIKKLGSIQLFSDSIIVSHFFIMSKSQLINFFIGQRSSSSASSSNAM